MSPQDLAALVDRLRREPQETEWLEFKENRCEPEVLGEYLSALANAACLAGKSRGYLVFGIQDQTHDVVGTQFNPQSAKAKGNQDLLIWLAMGLQPNIGFEVYTLEHHRGKIVMFEVRAAWDQPVKFYGTAFIRVGSSKTELYKHPEKERAIWSRRTDWSAHLCEKATVKDMDPTAIAKAREQFLVKHPGQALELAGWDDQAFLNKAKLTVQGAITNTSILLLGKPESSTLLSPAVGRISWILKDDQNREMDYEHFGPPFLLQVDRVLARIRNLNVRTLPSGTLFPQ